MIKDLKHLFSILEKRKRPEKNAVSEFNELLVSQYNMVPVFQEEIMKQIKRKKKGMDALIRVKLNNLEDIYMIDLLYKASKAGVKVRLLIRGICCIAPGKENLSENIEVKRIVDRFLEHSRILIFGEGIDSKVYIGSADWMTRNLQQRIEVCTPVAEERLKEQLVDYFEIQWNDKVKAVILDAELNQVRKSHLPEDDLKCPQDKIYEYLKQR